MIEIIMHDTVIYASQINQEKLTLHSYTSFINEFNAGEHKDINGKYYSVLKNK